MNSTDTRPLPLDELAPGDVLLSLGPDELSKLLAWNGDSDYSHGMLVCDDTHLIEAAVVGVRKVPLAERIADHDEMRYIDVYRPVDGRGTHRPAPELVPVVHKADAFEGYPYALSALKQLAIVVAIRNKLPTKPVARWAVRVALDHLMSDEEGHLTCTELLYRAFDEAVTTPAHALRPTIVVQPASDKPFPDIHWGRLWREVRALTKRRRSRFAGATAEVSGPWSAAGSPFPEDAAELPNEHPLITDSDLGRQLERVRQRLGPQAGSDRSAPLRAGRSAVEWIDPSPNPQAVIPVDFQTSPSYTRLGRLAMR